jgi:hypothetical protein
MGWKSRMRVVSWNSGKLSLSSWLYAAVKWATALGRGPVMPQASASSQLTHVSGSSTVKLASNAMPGLRVSIDVMPGGMISPQAWTRQGWSWPKLPSSRTVSGWLLLPSATQVSYQAERALARCPPVRKML